MEEPWIKISLGIFADQKIKKIRRDEGNDFILIWFMLLVLAGQCNDRGRIALTPTTPLDPDDLADDFGFSKSIINRAVKKFQELGMVDVDDEGFLIISNWFKHQNVDGMEKIKEKNEARKLANAKYYQKRKTQYIAEKSQTEPSENTSQDEIKISYKISEKSYSDRVEEDKEEDKENKKNIKKKKSKNAYGSYSNVFLTEDEYQRLGIDYGEVLRDEAIDYLSAYIPEKDYKTKDHNLTIRRWVINAVNERRQKNGYMGNTKAGTEPSEGDGDRFYSTCSSEECDRLLAECDAAGV